MKFRKLTHLPLAIALAVSSPIALQAGAAGDGHSHSHDPKPAAKPATGGHAHNADGSHAQTDHDHGNFKAPDTVEAAWTMLNTELATARKLAEEKKWDELHKQANALPVAINVLVDKADVIEDKDKRKRAEGALKQLDKAAGKLHHASEDKDEKATTAAFEQFDKLLALASAQYPEGVLPVAKTEAEKK